MLDNKKTSKFPFLKYSKKELLEEIQIIINNYSTDYQKHVIKLNSEYMSKLYYMADPSMTVLD